MSQFHDADITDVVTGGHSKDLEWQDTSCVDTSDPDDHHQHDHQQRGFDGTIVVEHVDPREHVEHVDPREQYEQSKSEGSRRSTSRPSSATKQGRKQDGARLHDDDRMERNPSFRDGGNPLASTLGKMSDKDILEYMNKRSTPSKQTQSPRQNQSPRGGGSRQTRQEEPFQSAASQSRQARRGGGSRRRDSDEHDDSRSKQQAMHYLQKVMGGTAVEDIERGIEKKKKHAAGSDDTDTNSVTGSHFGHDEIGKLALGFVWVTVAFMGLGSLITFIFWLKAENNDDRAMFGFTFVITLLAMFAYICKGLGQGTWVTSAGKAISWARYADWVITTPLLIVDMCKLAHADAAVTQMLVCLDIVMITGGVASAITTCRVRSLVWFAASTVMYVLMVVLIQSELGSAIESQSEDVKSLYEIFKTMTLVTWSFYPIVVLMGDQNAFCSCGIISHDAESIALSVLDIVSKVGVEILLVAMKVTSYATPAIAIGIAINGTVAVQVAAGGGAH